MIRQQLSLSRMAPLESVLGKMVHPTVTSGRPIWQQPLTKVTRKTRMSPSNRLLENFPQGSENILRQGRAKCQQVKSSATQRCCCKRRKQQEAASATSHRRQDPEGEDESKTPRKKCQEVAPLLYERRRLFPSSSRRSHRQPPRASYLWMTSQATGLLLIM
jgi:hypothetical protein